MSEQETNEPSEESTEEKQETMSPQQEKELREKAHKFYKDELPTLRLQAEYDRLHAELAESAYRNRVATMKLIHMDQEAAQAQADYNQAMENVKNGLQPDGSEKPKEEDPPEENPSDPRPTAEKPERKLATPEEDV